MQDAIIREMRFSIVSKRTQIPEPMALSRDMTNAERRDYLQEIGVPASAISPMWYFCNGGGFYENTSVLKTFLDTLLDYYVECEWEDAPVPYTEDWKDVRNEVLAKVLNEELYGF